MAIVSYVLVALGVLMILVGGWMTYKDWQSKQKLRTRRDALDKDINALTKLLKVLKDYHRVCG